MIKRISDLAFSNYHEYWVDSAVDNLQEQGYEVYEIKRVKRMKLGLFGTNVTEIYYRERNVK